MTFEMTPLMYPLLFVGALLAGWIDAIAGGAGLVTIPLLLGVGVPPQMVLGTNKFQASFGSFTAARHYVRKEVVPLPDALPGIALYACREYRRNRHRSADGSFGA